MLKYIAVLLVLVGSAMAQSSVIPYPGVPSGTCAPTKLGLDLANGHLYACNNGTWLEVGPGAAGAAAWNTITSGTNAGQTLTVGNGSTVTTTGTGIVNANQYAGIGTGTVSATEFGYLDGVTSAIQTQLNAKGTGTATSVGASFTGGLVSVGGTPVTTTGTLAFTVAGTSGGIPYFSGAATWASSGALTANLPVIGGGAGVAPSVGSVQGNTTKFVTYAGSAPTTNDCAKFDANGNLTTNGSACGGGGGSGTVTVVGSGSLTSTALVTGGGTTTLQTPSATSTLDASGNMNIAGTFTAGGSGGIIPGTAGVLSLGSATFPFQYLYWSGGSGSPGTNNFLISGASTSGTRTIVFPDSNTYVPIATNTITFAGPTGGNKTITFPDANTTVLTTNAAVTVAQGGTGLGTLTAHAVYVGNGTSAPTALTVGSTNQVLRGSTGADPAFGAILTADLPPATNTRTACATDIAPVTGDDTLITLIDPATAVHITRFSCGVTGTTSVIGNLVKGGASLIADATCTAGDANQVVVTTFANGSSQCGGTGSCAVAAHAPVTIHLGTISGTPTSFTVCADYTVD